VQKDLLPFFPGVAVYEKNHDFEAVSRNERDNATVKVEDE